ncbi:MAG: tetratricopeptide repeat protein, partial [Planctomycetales bacterium]|nr:tetratricopeptide repeat protein [Planctomycetales bacterium]
CGGLLTLPSCATWRASAPPVKSAQPAAPAHAALEESAEQFEQRRTVAELAAATASAERGDLSTCHSVVEAILKREPNNVDALLMMADVQLARDNPAAAERILRRVVNSEPDHAAAHFALGLLLESSARSDEAQIHFAQAHRLAPDDPLFALSAGDGAQ